MNNVTLDFSRPDKPTDNASINKLRQECLSANWFQTLADAREKLEGRGNDKKKFVLITRSYSEFPVAQPLREHWQ